MSTSMPASSNGVSARATWSRFIANRPTSVSSAKPSSSLPAGHLLVVPDHVVERERNLLPGFVLDDVGNLLRFDRRQLDEPRQAALPGHRDGDRVAASGRCARETSASASRISSAGSASGWLRILGYSM